MTIPLQHLTIRGESVQSLYASYRKGAFQVNRRYQRKLVWTIEEKRSFVDSLSRGFPVPLLLLTEVDTPKGLAYEIIDGMQRLNAIFSFLEGEFDLGGEYFDMSTIPETKAMLAAGNYEQKAPLLNGERCSSIVTYQLPLSVSRSRGATEIDEVFRRINSYGRHLSRQELRQAGAVSTFASLVRSIATRIRGDVSVSDRLSLDRMQQVSITNAELPYGLDVKKLFWVSEKILRSDQVRESIDEELIADLLAYHLLSPPPASSADSRDAFYGLAETSKATQSYEADLDLAIKKHGTDKIVARFLLVHNELRSILAEAGKTFNVLMFTDAGPRVPRYYQVVFLALYNLLVTGEMVVSDRAKLAKALDGIGTKFNLSEGGTWSANDRQQNVDAVTGMIKKHFKKREATDPATDSWITELENVLSQSKTENSVVELKLGLHAIVPPFARDDALIGKIGVTLSAMSNAGPTAVGYVLIGVTDSPPAATKLKTERSVECKSFNGFLIAGVDHEATDKKLYAKGLDSYFQWVVQSVDGLPLTETHRKQIQRDARIVSYYDHHVIVFKVTGQKTPCEFDGNFYERLGANNEQLKGAAVIELSKRFP